MSSLEKYFDIIESVIARQKNGATFSEAASDTGLSKASVHRILKSLVELDYFSYDPDVKRYRGSLKLAAIGAEVMANFDLRGHAHPHLKKLQQETGHTCNMGIKNGDRGIYIEKIETEDYGIKLFSEVGKSFPLHCTGLGRVILAWSSPEDVDSVLSRPLEVFVENTITDPEKIKERLDIVRKRGYALDMEEITRGIICTAAPVFGIDGQLIAAVSVTFPSYIYHERGIEKEIEAIKRHAAAMSGSLDNN